MILILNNQWVKDYLNTVNTAIANEVEENRDDVVGTKISRLLGLDGSNTKPAGIIVTALILCDIGLSTTDFTIEALEEGCKLIKEYELINDTTEVDWDRFIIDKVEPISTEFFKRTMIRFTLEQYFKDAFLFMMSRLTHVEVGSDNESLWFHFGA